MRRGIIAGAVALVAAGSIALGSSVVSASALAGAGDMRAAVAASENGGTWRGGCVGYVDEDLDGVCDNRGDAYCDGVGCQACGGVGCNACDATGHNACDGTGRNAGAGFTRCGQNGRGSHHGARNCW